VAVPLAPPVEVANWTETAPEVPPKRETWRVMEPAFSAVTAVADRRRRAPGEEGANSLTKRVRL